MDSFKCNLLIKIRLFIKSSGICPYHRSYQIYWHKPVDVLFVLAAKLCPTLCDPMDRSPPGSSVHGISQVRTLEWVATAFSTKLVHKISLLPPSVVMSSPSFLILLICAFSFSPDQFGQRLGNSSSLSNFLYCFSVC